MRIVAGTYKGCHIRAAKSELCRPSTDRVRESLFSALEARAGVAGAVVLDAFAGCGTLGIEALSRGASFVSFFERDRKTALVLQENLCALSVKARDYQLCVADVFSNFATCHMRDSYTLVLLDPPYAFDAQKILKFLNLIKVSGHIDADALISYECNAARLDYVEAIFADSRDFYVDKIKKYGKIGIAFLRLERRER